MASNSFGTTFRFTTWGESHGKAIGVVIDGCPPNIPLNEEDINIELARRCPGKTPYVSAREESDKAQILSGTFEGMTTGAPISILIKNDDVRSQDYEPIKKILRPGHANYTYLKKYGVFDYRGGGRASARETACRVAAGAVAKKILDNNGITVITYLKAVGKHTVAADLSDPDVAQKIWHSPIFCPCKDMEAKICSYLEDVKASGDSIGGIVECVALHIPPGLGDPIYEKMEARLAYAMLSIPASKGFEIGDGFAATAMRGSEHNDTFTTDVYGNVILSSNHAGGTLGGITTGCPLKVRVAFKPTSSIRIPQETVGTDGKSCTLEMASTGRHDPCVAIRAVPVVEDMMAVVVADSIV